jgi:hypothetical protein
MHSALSRVFFRDCFFLIKEKRTRPIFFFSFSKILSLWARGRFGGNRCVGGSLVWLITLRNNLDGAQLV